MNSIYRASAPTDIQMSTDPEVDFKRGWVAVVLFLVVCSLSGLFTLSLLLFVIDLLSSLP